MRKKAERLVMQDTVVMILSLRCGMVYSGHSVHSHGSNALVINTYRNLGTDG